jgi:hypothetical protein
MGKRSTHPTTAADGVETISKISSKSKTEMKKTKKKSKSQIVKVCALISVRGTRMIKWMIFCQIQNLFQNQFFSGNRGCH